LLYGVTPLDGLTMIGVAGLIAVLAIAAIARPPGARRASIQ
jgi:hypothetical protein